MPNGVPPRGLRMLRCFCESTYGKRFLAKKNVAHSTPAKNHYGGSSQTLIQADLTFRDFILARMSTSVTSIHSSCSEMPTLIHKVNKKRLRRPAAAPRRGVLAFVCMLGCVAIAFLRNEAAVAELYDGFETDKARWELLTHDCVEFRERTHRQSRRVFHTGGSSESIEFETGYGTRVEYQYQFDPIWLNYDIDVGVWVRATSPGVQLKMDVVLPNTLDATRRQPIVIPVHGSVYDRPGQWQHLRVRGALESLQKKLPVFRSQYGAQFSLKGAYIKSLTLNVYTGRGRSTVWIDDLAVQGGIAVDETRHLFAGPGIQAALRRDSREVMPDRVPKVRGNQLVGRFATPVVPSAADRTQPTGELKADANEDQAMFLRIARHQGESLRWLRSIGFNTVLVNGPVSEELNREARELDMWLIAPPPQLRGAEIVSETSSRVAVWWLGDGLTLEDVDRITALASQVRREDPARRPLGVSPRRGIWRFSRLVDILMFQHPGLGGDLELSEVSDWILRRQRQDFRRGVTLVELPTGYSPRITRQLEQLGMQDAAEAPLSPEQLRIMAFRAAAAGVRGICLQSNTRLDETTSAATARAANIEWILSELQIIAPWLATGLVGEQSYLANNGYELRSLRTDRSSLLFLFTKRAQQQHVVGGLGESGRMMSIPPQMGAPLAHQIHSYGIERIRVERRAGAREILLPNDDHVAMIVMSEDPLVMEHLARNVVPGRQKRAQLASEVASRNAEHVRLVQEALSRWLPPDRQIDRWFADADANLMQSRAMLENSEDLAAIHLFTHRAMNRLAQIRERQWRRTSAAFPRPVTTSAAAGFMTLPGHQMFRQVISVRQWGPNQMPAGDMEDLQRLMSTGWQQQILQGQGERAIASVELDSPFQGRSCLQLAIAAEVEADGSVAASLSNEPTALQIQTPPIRVRPGQIVQIRCAARLSEAGPGTQLVLRDSIGGEIQQWSFGTPSEDWTECLSYRVANAEGEFRVSASLQGAGKAQIDSLEVRMLER